MSGIYLHIPFCKQACHYCNFHFSTSLRYREEMVQAIQQELILQRDYLQGKPIETIYLGGGTPSLLQTSEIQAILKTIEAHYAIGDLKEITLEANPDDLTPEKLRELREQTPINRLSIGLQSFYEEDLRWMNRAHNEQQARACLENALAAGFSLITVDLIYGIPGLSDERWLNNLQTVFDYQIPHLSCYALTVEPRTALAHFVEKGKSLAPDDEHTARQFELLLEATRQNGYEQYEISNFCRPPHYAVHNSSYWQGAHYLGVGPSAHSFNGVSRQWNIANNAHYLKSIAQGIVPAEVEQLSPATQYNEYIMTALRTKWGVQASRLDAWQQRAYFEKGVQRYVQSGKMVQEGECYRLTDSGKLVSDAIISDLFVV